LAGSDRHMRGIRQSVLRAIPTAYSAPSARPAPLSAYYWLSMWPVNPVSGGVSTKDTDLWPAKAQPPFLKQSSPRSRC